MEKDIFNPDGIDLSNIENKAIKTSKEIGKDILEYQYGVNIDSVIEHSDTNIEMAYADLSEKLTRAKTNNDFITVFEGFLSLGKYKDSEEKCKSCLDKLSFSNPDELFYISRGYKKLELTDCIELGNKCDSVASQWQNYEKEYAEFYERYDSRPKLLKLWDKYSTIIIIIGIVTLLNGFVFYFGAVLLEFIFRSLHTARQRKSKEYKETLASLTAKKQEIDNVLLKLRNI